ncbi:SUN domain-containing ossification factor-like isoform X1 [Corythoichthys intestinalis]|uniref:SUN domain-containing ossification factor-like isoform X1 n=2 Tax=Corythoichthys intestinalis TaxID=161448 RepID=UPI0025A4F5D7|nr:SUN domain-containing ossification factor-like isoform X1 [Corythoichthys intestinalis]
MKMTSRSVTPWLLVLLVFGFHSCHFDGTEQDQEAQRCELLKGCILEDESGDAHHQHKTPELDEPAINSRFEVDYGISQPQLEPKQHLERENMVGSAVQDQESNTTVISTVESSVYESTGEENDRPGVFNSQDAVSLSEDASDEAHSGVLDSDLSLAECEEDTSPYNHEGRPPVVLENMSNAHTAGTEIQIHPSSKVQGSQHRDRNISHSLNKQDVNSAVTIETHPSINNKDPEDIPTFDEWKRKIMEVENEKTHSIRTSTNGGSNMLKKLQKNFNNYASVECGAKILGANPEAKSTSAILKENMDLYMLNPCSNKIWFIIELCEPIQVKQLDIANFELFSSTPKDFLVLISDRYPTNKWLKMGTFHAQDERTVQSFPLDEQLYAKYVKMFTKYIKVELLSHFGSEHFCPLSVIRIFGTSMVEEYEEIVEPSERPEDQDDDFEYSSPLGTGEVKHSTNVIGLAKDVILNMVNNIAINVLGSNSQMQGNISYQDASVNGTHVNETTAQSPLISPITDSKMDEVTSSANAKITETETLSTTATMDVLELFRDNKSENHQPQLNEQIVITLQPDEEESIHTPITLLDQEDELGRETEKMDHNEPQNVTFQSPIPKFFSCSCKIYLQEYLQQQCLLLLFSYKRKCQYTEKGQMAPSSHTSIWFPPSFPSACPEQKYHHSEAHQPFQKEKAPGGEPESEAPQPRANTFIEPHDDSMSEPSPLEPSQTSNLPKPATTDSSVANPTFYKTLQLSPEASAKPLSPNESQDMQSMEKLTKASLPLSSAIVGTVTDEVKVAATKVKLNIAISADPDMTAESQIASHVDQSLNLTALLESMSPSTEPAHPASHTQIDLEHSNGAPVMTDPKTADRTEDVFTHLPSTSSSPPLSDIYADPSNGLEQTGNTVHGSSQKESVFMRLNNRIKALEMNMSLSGRYLEQLSQRYRKQMEEMQTAFNKTIIKLQNTSRIAEQQDQQQTESIHLLQGQLQNVTLMVLNLSAQVSQLQNEVSDKHNYLLLCLLLILGFGLSLFANRCCISITPPYATPDATNFYTHCCPERNIATGDERSLKRSASYPQIHSFQLVPRKGPESLHSEESQPKKKKRRRKIKSIEKVETLTSCATSLACDGSPVLYSAPVTTHPASLTRGLLLPSFRDSPSEGSSETSSHSDDPSCGITLACSQICERLAPRKTLQEKKALRRRHPKPTCAVVVPSKDKSNTLSISAPHDMKSNHSTGTLGITIPLSGPV